MRVLIACEFSGITREMFRKYGHDAYSCDLLDTETRDKTYHLKGDVRDFKHHPDGGPWDLMVAFPPCTYLAVSGARWFKDRAEEQEDAIAFIKELMDFPIDRIALENPIGVLSTKYRKPDQIVQPYQFGHGETKATCLWLKNLPLLKPTRNVKGRVPKVHWESPGPNRWKNRSRTKKGLARAMAKQWTDA